MFGYHEVLIFSPFYNKNSSYINTLKKKLHYTLDHKLHSVKKRSEMSETVSGCSSHGFIIGPVCDFKIESNLKSHHSARVKTLIPVLDVHTEPPVAVGRRSALPRRLLPF